VKRLGFGLLGCAAAAAVVLALAVAVARSSSDYNPVLDLDYRLKVEQTLRELSQRPVFAPQLQVAVLGDSTVMSYPIGHDVTSRLQWSLERELKGRWPVRTHSLAAPGMGPFAFYAIAHDLAQARPDCVVAAFNLTSLSNQWPRSFARPGLAGWASGDQILEAVALPLHHYGVSFDRLLLYVSIVRSGGFSAWRDFRRFQLRFVRAYRYTVDSIEGAPRDPPSEAPIWLRRAPPLPEEADGPGAPSNPEETATERRPRYDAADERRARGAALDGAPRDHPALRLLGAAIRVFDRAGIPVLVYVAPVSVDNLRAQGVHDAAGLATTIEHLRSAVESNGGELLDLHALLPDEGFRDGAGHFATEGPVHGSDRVARALAPRVAAELAARAEVGS
jgi:hypothetical protein